jgi:hypothetical protein
VQTAENGVGMKWKVLQDAKTLLCLSRLWRG